MRRIKGIGFCILLILCEIFILPGVTNNNCVSAEAATIKINKSFLSLEVGKTYTLEIIGTKSKVTWSSNNRKVATVNSDGIVKAIAKGNAVITGKVGSKKYTCRVTVEEMVKNMVSKKEAIKNLTYEEAETKGGLVVIFENKNNVDLFFSSEVSFYDGNDQVISKGQWSGILLAEQKYITLYNYAMDRSGNQMEYAYYQLEVDAEVLENSNAQNHIEDIGILAKEDIDGQIAAEITNNSDEYINTVSVAAVFYRSGRIVGCTFGDAQELAGKKSTTILLSKPTNMYGPTQPIIYDEYKIFVNGTFIRE